MDKKFNVIGRNFITLQNEVANGRIEAATPFSSIDESF
jgi:hypothetical protein